MNQIKQYRPSFVDSDEDTNVIIFSTLEELKSINFVKRFVREGFNRFSKLEDKLMAEYENGEFWVVGFIKKPEQVNLPEWKHPTK